MSEPALYCTQCGRSWRPRTAPDGMQLHCAACGGRLAGPAERADRRSVDPFRRRTIAGACLRKLVAVRPTHYVYRAVYLPLRAAARVEAFTSEFAGRNAAYVEDQFRAAAATRELRGTHVVTLLDIGRRSDCWFIVQEWTPSDLRALMDRKAPLPVNRALGLLEGVLTGLETVREAGFVHGNVTPEGILLAGDGSPVLDHLAAPPRTEERERLVLSPDGCLSGPALYMPPERAGGREGDIRSDLYALGAVAFEMLSGRPPYTGRTAAEVLAAHIAGPAADLRDVLPDVPEEIAAFVAGLMARDPADRPATPGEALEELRAVGVDLSRRREIGPVEGSLTPKQRARSAVRWTLAWTFVALLLVALAIVPGVLMCREQWHEGQARPAAPAEATGKVVVAIGRGDGSDLPADRAAAVRALMRYALSFYPAFEPADAASVQARLDAGEAPVDAARALGADYVFTASYAVGLGRRRWMLALQRPSEQGWIVTRECAVEEGEPDGLAPLERAAGELLSEATARLRPGEPAPSLPVTGADPASWVHLANALRAEREGRLQEAFEQADAAARRAPHPAPFALLAAFYDGVIRATETGRFPPLPELARDELPPGLAALAGVLDALAAGDDAATEERFADYLIRFPKSARGYWLLGLWRLKAQGRADDALVAFRHALEGDPGYAPATQGVEEAQAAGKAAQ
jgi:tetratricopeptide (TPR) repeat protein